MVKLDVKMERVTPELAEEWLKRNVQNNRAINQARVQSYMHDMMSGKWSQNGETIKFDRRGALIDGQHRLTAVAKCGRPVWMLIARGVDDDAFRTVDVNMVRTARQIIRMGGADEIRMKKNVVGGATALLVAYAGIQRPTQSMIEECIESNRDYLEWYYSTFPNAANLPASYLAVAIVGHVHGVPDRELVGLICGAHANHFDEGKDPRAFKLCVQLEAWRKSVGRSGHYSTQMQTFLRYLYSYANNMHKLTSKTGLYPSRMKSNYRVVKEGAENGLE